MRRACVAGLVGALALCICPPAFPAEGEPAAVASSGTIEFEGKRWNLDSAHSVTVEEYKGRTALGVRGRRDTYVHLADVELRDGTIEVDIAAQSRATPGVGFRGRNNGESYDRVVFGPARRSPMNQGSLLEQAVITRRGGTLLLLRLGLPAEREPGKNLDLYGWFHVKIVVCGQGLRVYFDDSREPIIIADKILDGDRRGTVGVCGNDFYFANFRYTSRE
ncbi:MAG: hypothetical protein HQ582_28420 [Planctomycetes bacterium]|nr:hypothetical protein [Planctomycetota bacterium]